MTERELRWRKARVGCITSSGLAGLMKSGRGKDNSWGDTAISYMYEKRYERVRSKSVRNEDNKNFRWGHEQEPMALAWLRENTMWNVKGCTDDFVDIVFIRPFPDVAFGDSPDFYAYDEDGVLFAVGEIKCLASQEKFDKYTLCTREELIGEYRDQFVGHLLAHPEVDRLLYVIYDGKAEEDELDEVDELAPERGIII